MRYGLGAASHDWRLVGVDFAIGPYDFPADELLEHVIRPDGHRRTEFRLWDPLAVPGFDVVLKRVPPPGSPFTNRDVEMIGSVNGFVGIQLMHEIKGPMPAGYSAAALFVTA